MKLKNTSKVWVLGATLLCAATAGSALTLGRARGAILLGQPLSLTVAIQADSDEASADLCFDADVFYGEVRLESSRVRVTPLRAEGGEPTAVRINASTPIDEPIVTVYLRSDCGAKTSRKYVLLSDLVSEMAPATSNETLVRATRPPVQVTPNVEAAAVATKPTPVRDVGGLPKLPKAKEPRVVRPVTLTTKADLVPRAADAKSGSKQKSRLKLSILDLVDVKDPDLKISNELSNLPSDDPGKREAASALWQSLNKSAQDILKDTTQQKHLADDVKSLREISSKNQRDLQELVQRLQDAEAQRYANPVIYILVALLALAAGGLVYLLSKMRNNQSDVPWWRTDGHVDNDDPDSRLHMEPVSPSVGPMVVSDTQAATPAASIAGLDFSNSGLDIDLDLGDAVVAAPEAPQPVERKDVAVAVKAGAVSGMHRDQTHSLHASLYAINTQEMLDVRQQADFFMTLGQHEEAISLLEGNIQDSESSNPLVYLDLLKVLHTLSRKPAFDQYRSEFNSIFTGRVQAYATFGQPGNTLDAYPQICAEITELWGTGGAIDFLEQCMVRRPEDAAEMYFDLDAFRDLLTLHAVASRLRLDSNSDSGLLPFSAVRIQALPELQGMDGIAPPERPSGATLPVVPELLGNANSVDLDISTDENLIDFDASGLSVNLIPSGEK
jgi:pilus assembly protein FimV